MGFFFFIPEWKINPHANFLSTGVSTERKCPIFMNSITGLQFQDQTRYWLLLVITALIYLWLLLVSLLCSTVQDVYQHKIWNELKIMNTFLRSWLVELLFYDFQGPAPLNSRSQHRLAWSLLNLGSQGFRSKRLNPDLSSVYIREMRYMLEYLAKTHPSGVSFYYAAHICCAFQLTCMIGDSLILWYPSDNNSLET